jgi:hypothetical protein
VPLGLPTNGPSQRVAAKTHRVDRGQDSPSGSRRFQLARLSILHPTTADASRGPSCTGRKGVRQDAGRTLTSEVWPAVTITWGEVSDGVHTEVVFGQRTYSPGRRPERVWVPVDGKTLLTP